MPHMSIEKVVSAWVDHNQRGKKLDHAHTDNIGFTRRILRSYGTPIACYHTGPTHRIFALFREFEMRGQAAHRHASMAYFKVGVPRIRVANVNIEDSMKVHEDNLVQMYADFSTKEENCVRSFRVGEGQLTDGWRSMLANAHEEIADYVRVAGIDACPPELEGRMEHVLYERMKRWDAWMEPKMVARRERAAARKLAHDLLLGRPS